MSDSVFKKTIAMGSNNKPYWLNRFIAGLVDVVLLFFSLTLVYALLVKTPIANNLNRYHQDILAIQDQAKLDSGYGYRDEITEGEEGSFLLHYDEEDDYYYIVKNVENPSQELTYDYQALLDADDNYNDICFSYDLNNYMIMCLAGFFSELILYFVFPICNKRRATVGQLICGLQVISTRRINKAGWYQILGRFFFIFMVESALPYFLINKWAFLVMPILIVTFSLFNEENRSLSAFVSGTKLIESKTFSPLVEDE